MKSRLNGTSSDVDEVDTPERFLGPHLFDRYMTPVLSKWKRGRREVLTSLALGGCVFLLGYVLAVWLTVHNVHGLSAFLDNVAAGAVASLVVLLYERSRQRAVDRLFFINKALESTSSAIWISDAQGHHFYQNKALFDLFGYATAEELEAAGGGSVVVKDPEVAREMFENIMSGKFWESDLEMVTKSGHVFPAHERADAIKNHDGEVIGLIGIIIDITERKRAEEELQRLIKKDQGALRVARMGHWEFDVATAQFAFNDQYYSLHGTTAEEAGGYLMSAETFASRYVRPDDAHLVDEAIQLAIETIDPTFQFEAEVPILRADGELRSLAIWFRVEKDPHGRTTKLLGVNQDITERKRAEAELQRQAQLMGQVHDVIITTDLEGFVTSWNAAATRMFGYSAEEALGKPVSFLYAEDQRSFLAEAVIAPLKQKGRHETEAQVCSKSGREFPIHVSLALLKDTKGDVVGMIGSSIDITERKQAEEALRRSEVKYRTVVEMTGTGYLIIDSQGRVLDANQEYVRMSGHGALREILGRSVIEWTAKGAKQRNAEALAQCAKERFIRNFVTEYVDGNGQATFIEVNATVEGEGESLRIVSLCRDVTERKRQEQAIQELSGRLISAQEQERSRIARELHDDINQRLALLAVNMERLKQELPKSAVGLRNRLQEEIKHLSNIASDIQALSHRLHSSKLEYLGLAAAAASFCRELSDLQKVEIDFHADDIPKKLPQEISLCLFRILQEALQNAAKHSGSKRIQVLLSITPNEIHLTVQDSGIGFDLEEALKGRGLGLTSMKERLNLVDGALSVDSKPQGGTTIHASVPLSLGPKSVRAAG